MPVVWPLRSPVASTKHLKAKERKTYNLYETSPSKAVLREEKSN